MTSSPTAGPATARDAESGVLSQFLAGVTTGPAGLIIQGDAGIGKTTLWRTATSHAAQLGFRVLSAGASAAEVRLTFAVLADLLCEVDEDLLDRLPPVQRVALNRVLLRGDDGPATDERVAAAASLSVIEQLATRSRVLLAIDDAQWLDAPSRAVVSFVVRRLRGPVAIVATARTGDSGDEDLSWLRLAKDNPLTTLRVGPLSLGEVHSVIMAATGRTLPRPAIARIHEICGGNPFYALELARTLEDDPSPARLGMPGSLTALLRQRLGDLGDDASRLLLAAACAAGPTVGQLASATMSSLDDVLAVLNDVEQQGIITLERGRVHFTHPLLAYGVYRQSSDLRRRAMHRRLAAVTEIAELRARHLALAAVDADTETLTAIDVAANAAAARGAPSAAAELVDLAIGLGNNDPLRCLRAAELHFRAGSLDEADARLESVIDSLPPGALRAVALMLRGAVDGYGDRFTRTVELLRQAVQEAADNPGVRVQARLLLTLAVGITGDVAASMEHARRAVADAEQLGHPALHSQALALWVHIAFMRGLGTDEHALATALAQEDRHSTGPADCRASAVAAINDAWTGNLHRARRRLADVAHHCRSRGQEFDVIWAAPYLTMVDLWLGLYQEAEHIAVDAVERAEQIGGQLPMIEALTAHAAVAAYHGRVDQARQAARTAIDTARGNGIHLLAIAPTTSLAFLEVSLGNYADAAIILEPLLATFDPTHDTEIFLGGFLPEAIETLVALQRHDEAEHLVAALETSGRRLDRPWMLAIGARGRAMLLAAHGDLPAATTAAQQALQHHQRLPMPLETARTHLLLGKLHRRSRRRQLAAQTLDEAVSTFEALGSTIWAARARAERDRITARLTNATALTPTEELIAEHAAAGLSNRDIAAALFLAPKTVEMNLTRVYRKLEIQSRAQLHNRLRGEEPTEGTDFQGLRDG